MKNVLLLVSILLFATVFAQGESKNKNQIHHSIQVDLNNEQSKIIVKDCIDLSSFSVPDGIDLHFYLNKNLHIDSCNYKIEEVTGVGKSNWKEYQILGKIETTKSELQISYHGIIADEKESLLAPPKRGGSKETSGIVFDKGIYLSGSTAWVPRFDKAPLVTFQITATIDPAWNILTQGEEISNKLLKTKRQITYESLQPTNHIYLLGNKWTDYSQKCGAVLLQAFLIHPDEKLAAKYLAATARYLKMYEKMIGEYPYSKFALVENFWETGYGMPSFTLLGQRVIRMPWIIASSYPHELLHNYWGNSVFVDYSKGNWSEGITTYMADHLLKEMKGQGVEYRQSALQKYTNYVNAENDFPVMNFKSRTTKASSAIGYDKVVMINHMLRVRYGEDKFLEAYANFYKTNRFKKVSFDEIRNSFEMVTGDDLSLFFHQWINRTGVPEIAIINVKQDDNKGMNRLTFTIKQTQNEEVFHFDLPFLIYQKGKVDVQRQILTISKRSQNFTFDFDSKIERLEFDPNFDVMRRLDSREVPVTVSSLLGASSCVVILPGLNPNFSDYQAMTEKFKMNQKRQGKQVLIYKDIDLERIPKSDFVWIMGVDNKFAKKAAVSEGVMASLGCESKAGFENLNGSLFYIQSIGGQNIAFIDSKNTKQLTRIFMKMGHYGGYSYLGFQGTESKNTLKGVFPILNSPMIFNLDQSFNPAMYKAKEIRRSLLGEI